MVLVLSYESLVPMKQTQIKETKQKRKKSKQILLEIIFPQCLSGINIWSKKVFV